MWCSSNDELDAVKLETTRTIEIERFVDEKDIDRLYWNDPYYLLPNEKGGVEAYTVIREALARSRAASRWAASSMHTRERLVALEPRDKGILVYTLRMADEVVPPKDAFADIPAAKPDKQHDRDRPQDHRAAGRRIRARTNSRTAMRTPCAT